MTDSSVPLSIRSVKTDAETGASVGDYVDGRVVVLYTDNLRVCLFPDGSKFTTHPSGNYTFKWDLIFKIIIFIYICEILKKIMIFFSHLIF